MQKVQALEKIDHLENAPLFAEYAYACTQSTMNNAELVAAVIALKKFGCW